MSFSKPSNWKLCFFRLVIFSFSIIAGLLLCEILTRILVPQDFTGTWYENSPHGANINKANWVSRHQVGRRVIYYRLNGLHLRGGPVGDGIHRILCLGDSFAFGYLMAENDTFVSRLGEMARRDFPEKTFEFLNGGIAGAGTGDMVLFTEDFASQIKPSAIVVFLHNDDVERTIGTGLFRLDTNDAGQAVWVPKPSAVKSLREKLRRNASYQWLLEHSALMEVIRNAVDRNLIAESKKKIASRTPAEDESNVRLEKALFLRLRHWCDDNHCRLLVLTTGYDGFPQYPFGWKHGNANGLFFSEAAAFFDGNKIPFYDLGPEMSAELHGDFSSIIIPDDFHPNERGNELIAGLAWPWLKPRLIQLINSTNPPGAAK